jgi:hypothetical protein
VSRIVIARIAGILRKPLEYLSRKGNKGLVLVLMAWVTGILIGITGLAIDVSNLYTVRGQIEQAVDMAALRGAVEMITMPDNAGDIHDVVEATLRSNPVMGDTDVGWRWNVSIRGQAHNVADTVVVSGNFFVHPFFMGLFGVDSIAVPGQAMAKLVSVSGAYCFVPYTLTDRFNDNNGNGYWDGEGIDHYSETNTGYNGSTDIGQLMYIKYHSLSDTRPHKRWVYGVHYDEAPGQEDIWCNSGDEVITVGSPMNLVDHGPGILALKADNRYWDDRYARWSNQTKTIQNSRFPLFESPRIIKLPVHNPNNRRYVNKLMSVFIENPPSGADSVLVRTINILNYGEVSDEDGVSFVKSARLIMPPH